MGRAALDQSPVGTSMFLWAAGDCSDWRSEAGPTRLQPPDSSPFFFPPRAREELVSIRVFSQRSGVAARVCFTQEMSD